MKYFLLSLLSLLALVSCDFHADEVGYEDVKGMYRGDGEAFVTVNNPEGMTLPDGRHLNYGDTLVDVLKSPEPLLMGVMVNNEGRLMFGTSVPMIHVLGREMKITSLSVDELPVINKGNHIISWGPSQIETPSRPLLVETVYIPLDHINIDFVENDVFLMIEARGYVAVSIVNYTIQMDLMIEEAPFLLTEGCALWMKYKGVMYTKEVIHTEI